MKEHHRKFFLAATLFLGATMTLWAQAPNAARTVDRLRDQIQAHLDEPKFSEALWGIKVVSLDSGKTIFEQHPDRLMSPASNSKLYTGALGLTRLGGDYRFETPVYATGKISHSGTLRGNLVIVGHGDPSWNPRRLGTNFWAIFDPFVNIITNAGVRRIQGDIIADATFFQGPPTGSGWMIDDLDGGEVGMLSALTLDDNTAQVQVEPGAQIGERCAYKMLQPGTGLTFSNETTTVAAGVPGRIHLYRPVGSATFFILGELPAGSPAQTFDVMVPRPANWFAAALKIALAQRGIKVSGQTAGLAWPDRSAGFSLSNSPAASKLGSVYSPPLREVVRLFMKPSQNLEADTLLADVGEASRDSNAPPSQTSERAGLAALDRFLDAAGVPQGDVHFDEGSGLSRNNLTTANATVALLQYMEHNKEGQDLVDALPVAGVDGTLRRRYQGTAAADNVRAKTGTLRWAQALSGYVTTAAHERLAFSIMLNRFVAEPGHSGHDEIMPIVLALANFAGRSDDISGVYASYGTVLLTQFVNAPFPHPARAEGHSYHDEFYSTSLHYMDSTVAMFIPKNFRTTDKIDFVVHFHGWRHNVVGTLEEYKLISQFADSGKNAILIVPQGPRNVPDSFGGKLEDTNGFKLFMDEAVDKLRASGVLSQTNFDIGNIIISGHSGGYEVMAAILDHGGMSDKIRETWLFDALYAGTEKFVAWQKNQDGRFVDIYTDHGGTRQEVRDLMASYRKNGVSFFTAEETNAVPDNLLTNKIVFLHTDLIHNDVVSKRGEFCEFLKTSCLQNK